MNLLPATIRERLNRYPLIVMGGATFLMLGSLSYVVIAQGILGSDTTHTAKALYFDLNTQEFFTAGAAQRTPIESPSGPLPTGEPAGVRAWAFGCAGVTEPEQATIVVLETYHPAAFTDEPIVSKEQSAYGPNVSLSYLYRELGEKSWSERNFDIEKVFRIVSDGCGNKGAALITP